MPDPTKNETRNGLMHSSELISEGINLMLFGMGFVFVFLTLLVFVTGLMSSTVNKLVKPAPVVANKPAPVSAPAAGNNDELIAVMTAAVHKYRSGK
ncbi:OadG family protein [Oceanospirillum maris]|uniref:OadG family protein n=1 Tax=Oceanospirillum maris TaxID=64977 RepID=UPI0004038152|nr:OadG family transporter subunit [Oceanospirillum maris]